MIDTAKASLVDEVIRDRRSTKPAAMNGRSISRNDLEAVLEAADWAPTHAYTEPWLFLVYEGEKAREFCLAHADKYRAVTPPEKFTAATYDKLATMADKVSHLVVAVMQRGDNPKIPVLEEVAATAAAVQNLLLSATARGIASFWSTGGLTLQPAMKELLGLGEQDHVLGQLYLGYTEEEWPVGKRLRPRSAKFVWK